LKAETKQKYEALKTYLKVLGSVAIAYSSGVDSTLLLLTAKEVLGDKVIAVTAKSCSFPVRELNEAIQFCKSHQIKHIIVESEELEIEGFSENKPNRCYLCKRALFSEIIQTAQEYQMRYVCEGSNIDDLGDYRPGLTAIKELNVKSPLRECGLNKAEIREISSHLGLNTASKPSFACLASRFVYGETITREKLGMVEKAEELLLSLGFRQLRVRIHGTLARIEVSPDEINKLLNSEIRIIISTRLKEIGFSYVTLDLIGYRTGSMNEVLPQEAIDLYKIR